MLIHNPYLYLYIYLYFLLDYTRIALHDSVFKCKNLSLHSLSDATLLLNELCYWSHLPGFHKKNSKYLLLAIEEVMKTNNKVPKKQNLFFLLEMSFSLFQHTSSLLTLIESKSECKSGHTSVALLARSLLQKRLAPE